MLLASLYVGIPVVPANPVHPAVHPIVVPVVTPAAAHDSITRRAARGAAPTDATHDAARDADASAAYATRWSSGFTYAAHGIFVRVALDGVDAGWFLLDTGASATVVDDRIVSRHHLVPAGYETVEGAGRELRARVYRLGDVSVNGATAFAVTGVAQDLTGFPAPEGESLAGILGSDFLAGFAVTIDFATHQVTFSVSADSTASGRTRIHFTTDHGAPRVPVMLDGNTLTDFRIDTGLHGSYDDAPYVAVTSDVWRALSRTHATAMPVREVSARGIGDDEGITLPAVRIRRLAIGAASIESPWVVPQQRRGYFADDAVSLLGNGVLEHFGPVTIDYLTGTLYLTTRR
jgi:hypothetical protein